MELEHSELVVPKLNNFDFGNDELNPDIIAKAEQTVRRVFGFGSLRPNQIEVLQSILAGRDTLAIMPTGGGKSLCYALPAVMSEGMVIIISPLIALIRDQVVKMRTYGIPAAAVDSMQTSEQKRQVFEGLKQQRVKMLFVSPERLSLPSFRALLSEQNIKLIAIDEAHCISQWGQNFRPEYRKIGEYLQDFSGVTKLAVTATARKQVREDIIQVLQMTSPSVQVNCPARNNIQISIEQFSSVTEQLDVLVEDICLAHGQGIVYASTRKSVVQIVKELRASGQSADAYHAGMSSSERENVLHRFIEEKVRVVVATNAFGMGVDKANIRFVFHHGVPQSFEQYIQEIGRGGRDGLICYSKLYYTSRDLHIQKYIMEKSFVESFVLKLCLDKLPSAFAEEKVLAQDLLAVKLSQKVKIDVKEAEAAIDAFYREGWLSKWSEINPQGQYHTSLRLETIPKKIFDFIEQYENRKTQCLANFDALKKFIYSSKDWHQQIEDYFKS